MIADLLNQTGLSLERLNSFCLVASAGGVTKAAKGDPARQSLYSRQMKELEEFFGTELVRRKGRGIVLTPAGQRLNTVVREAFASLSDFRAECQNRPVEIVIGAGESIIQWLLMARLQDIRKQLPGVRFKLLNLPTQDAVKRLSEGTLDFAIVRRGAVVRPLRSVPLGVMNFSLFIPAGIELEKAARRGPITLPIATLEGDGTFRADLTAATVKHRTPLNIQLECSTFTLAAQAVTRGAMAAILPSIAAVELSLVGVKAAPAPFLKALGRDILLAWNPRIGRIRPVLQEVSAVLESTCRF